MTKMHVIPCADVQYIGFALPMISVLPDVFGHISFIELPIEEYIFYFQCITKNICFPTGGTHYSHFERTGYKKPMSLGPHLQTASEVHFRSLLVYQTESQGITLGALYTCSKLFDK